MSVDPPRVVKVTADASLVEVPPQLLAATAAGPTARALGRFRAQQRAGEWGTAREVTFDPGHAPKGTLLAQLRTAEGRIMREVLG